MRHSLMLRIISRWVSAISVLESFRFGTSLLVGHNVHINPENELKLAVLRHNPEYRQGGLFYDLIILVA